MSLEAWETDGGAVEPVSAASPATDLPTSTVPIATSLPKMDQPGVITKAFKARLAALAGWDPAQPAPSEPEVPEGKELRRSHFTGVYDTSLTAGQVANLASWRLDALTLPRDPHTGKRPDPQHGHRLRMWVDKDLTTPQPRVLNTVLTGRVGSGKTTAAVAAGWAMIAHARMVRFVRHGAYLAMLRPDGAPAGETDWMIRRRYRQPDLLILDDLGAELDGDREATRFVRDETLSLIGDRVGMGKATIITTNEASEVLDDQGRLIGGLALTLGERVLSRISERGAVLSFVSEDRRGRLRW